MVRGFGRGSSELGIKTANLDADALAGSLADAVTGIFAGWARVGDDPTVYKTALSVGYNPHYGNTVRWRTLRDAQNVCTNLCIIIP